MAFVDKNGKIYQDQNEYAESLGYRYNPWAGGWFDPSGNIVSDSDIKQMTFQASQSGELFPDGEHLVEWRGYGYKGPEASEAAAQNFSEQQMEGMPGYESLIDPTTKLLQSPYQLTDPESILDMYKGVVEQYGLPGLEKAGVGVDELAGIARDTGFSPYATAQLEQQRLNEAGLRDTLQSQLASGQARGLSSLASSGGYDSGARERLLRGTGISGMMAGQNIARGGAEARAGIGASDAMYKQNLLSSLPNMYSNLATTGTSLWNPYLNQATTEQRFGQDTKQFNIDKALAEYGGQRNFDLEKFKLQKQLEASARQSYAESDNPYAYGRDLYR